MSDLPIITVAILVFNQKKNLKKVLDQLKKIVYPWNKIEIIVIDNSAKDKISFFLKKTFPKARYVKLSKNYGIAGWNFAFQKMKGEICLVLDHDSYVEPDGLNKVLKYFKKRNIGIVACNIINPFSRNSELKFFKKSTPTYSYDFIGGGVFIKKDVFNTIGYFDENIFIYGHETDFSLRAINRGIKILYAPEIHVFRTVEENRINELRMKYGTGNLLWIYWRYLSFWHAFLCSVSLLIENFLLSIISGNIGGYYKGILLFMDKENKDHSRKFIKKNVENEWIKTYPFTLKNLVLRALKIYKVQSI